VFLTVAGVGPVIGVWGRRDTHRRRNAHKAPTTREWILKKKDVARKRGAENVPVDSKYTGRKRRRPQF